VSSHPNKVNEDMKITRKSFNLFEVTEFNSIMYETMIGETYTETY